jgi:adenine-specific DNA-methyltransferase
MKKTTPGLEDALDLFNQEPLVQGWSREGLKYELCLLEGFVLSSILEKQPQYKRNEVVKVSDEYCEHSLLVCLDKEVKPETTKSLELSGNDIFICLDSAISNVDKLKLSDKGLIKTI